MDIHCNHSAKFIYDIRICHSKSDIEEINFCQRIIRKLS